MKVRWFIFMSFIKFLAMEITVVSVSIHPLGADRQGLSFQRDWYRTVPVRSHLMGISLPCFAFIFLQVGRFPSSFAGNCFYSLTPKNGSIWRIYLPTNCCSKLSESLRNCPISPESLHITQTGKIGSLLNLLLPSSRSISALKYLQISSIPPILCLIL